MRLRNMVHGGSKQCLRTLALSLLVACFINTSAAAQGTARTVKMGATPPTIFMRYNYATLFRIPESEVIEYLILGDKQNWSMNRESHNIFHVGPKRALSHTVKGKKVRAWDGKTNVHAIARSGNDYTFDLQEVDGKFDASITVESNEPAKEETASLCDTGLKMQLTEATLRETQKQNKIDRLNRDLQGKVDPAEFIASVQDDYKIPRKLRGDPFKVSRIYSRGGFTYIRSKAWRQPAFYEKDGKEKRHVNYSYREGVYTIPGEVTEGCLKIGKHEGCFKRKG